MKTLPSRAGGYVGMAATIAVAQLMLGPVWADDDEWKVKWDNGFKVGSPDGNFELAFGGRIQADWTFTDPDAQLEMAISSSVDDGNEFRRARLFVSGIIYEKVEFKAQYDFAGGDANFRDVYIGFKDTPIGNLRFGHFKEPFSLEELTSSKYITFLERSLPNVFAPDRNTGFMVFDHVGDRFTWAVGAFREADDFGGTDNGEGKLSLTVRFTGLPLYEKDGRRLIHVGVGVTQKDLGDDLFRFAQSPEAHQSPDVVDTTGFAAEDFNIYGAEIAAVAGRFWAAAEYMQADGDAPASGDPTFDGGYVQAGLFLTDDYRPYKTSSAVFDRMKPGRNLGGGGGAWEVAVRYSMLDLTDAGITGGELEDLGFGVNWYPNPATRLMFDYITSETDDPDNGDADFFLVRLQVEF